MMIEKREIPIREKYDVIVSGGGIGGIAAALASARQGMKVLLLEKSCVLGGLATLGLVNWYEPLCDGLGEPMTGGIARELLELSIAYGYQNLPKQWLEQGEPKPEPNRRFATLFNPAMFSLALNDLVLNNGITLRYDIIASWPVMEGKRCKGIITESKEGRCFFPCEILIDGTGDGDVFYRAGAPCRITENYFTYYGHGCNFSSIQRALEKKDLVELNSPGFHVGSDLNGKGHPSDMPLFSGKTNEEISQYICTGQKKLLEQLKEKGTETHCLYTLPGMPQTRKTRCIMGAATFTGGQNGCRQENAIGVVGDFRKKGYHYELPAQILFCQDYPNLLAVGRIVSAKGDGWEITRVIPTAALTGQGSGTLAALAVKNKVALQQVPVFLLQKHLIQGGVRLHWR